MKRGGEEEKEEKGGEEEKQEENSSSKKPKYFTQWLTYHLTVCVIRHGQIRNNYERKQSCIIIKYYHRNPIQCNSNKDRTAGKFRHRLQLAHAVSEELHDLHCSPNIVRAIFFFFFAIRAQGIYLRCIAA